MHICSWNVNGIRAVAKRNQLPWDQMPEVEVWCLQETKARADQLGDLAEPDGWFAHWHSAEKAGYSGVALLARTAPDRVVEGLGETAYDAEGRVLTGVWGDLAVIGAYFPNSQDGGKRIDFKLGFCAAMERHLAALRRQGLRTVLLGDYNIAHKPIDLARPKENEGNAGYLPGERAWMERYLGALGYRDVFRERHPDEPGLYTWWVNWGGARARNIGWRIDYATVSPDLADRVRDARIHPDILGSDHCPVSIILE